MKKIKKITIYKVLLIGTLLLYGFFGTISQTNMLVDGSLLLFFSAVFIYKARKNMLVYPIAIFIGYCLYSIAVGEFLVAGDLSVPMTEVKTLAIYGLTLRLLTVFFGIVSILFKKVYFTGLKFKIDIKNNIVIFSILYFMLIIVGLFGVNRSLGTSYQVSISPIYEYSVLLFLFAYYYSGGVKIRKFALMIMYVAFILQDLYYGGRITSLQLMLMMSFTLFRDKLTIKKVSLAAVVGIVLNSFVGAYRSSYSISGINLLTLISNLKDRLFVFDTPPYAFYASATHVASVENSNISSQLRIESLTKFVEAVLFGSGELIGNVTRFVSAKYYNNIGGGILPTHVYFWMGWFGVILAALTLAYIFNGFGNFKSNFSKISYIIFLVTTPRWFLYNPLSLFRPLLFGSILFIVLNLVHQFLRGVSTKKYSVS